MKLRESTLYKESYRNLVRRMIELRQKAGLSQTVLAESIGLEQPDISKIENFERRLDALELMDWLAATAPIRHAAVKVAIESNELGHGK